MGSYWGFFFGEADIVIIEEVAKVHNISKEDAAKYYKAMSDNIKNDSEK